MAQNRNGVFAPKLSLLALAVATCFGSGAALAGAFKGPSTSISPYNVPSPGVDVISIVTVNDPASVAPAYKMVGVPDGLGAYDNRDGTFTVLMNHELGGTAGAVRGHGQRGAFVSEWVINKSDLKVISGGDLIKSVFVANTTGTVAATAAESVFNRFCSADLPAATAFFNSATGLGSTARIFMNGEEAGSEGRAVATVASAGPGKGNAYILPSLGKFSWENSVASPLAQDKTIVMGMDDSTPGQVYMYVGQKQSAGNEVERAGLVGGSLYGVKVAGIAAEARVPGVTSGTAFSMEKLGDVSAKAGDQVQADSVAKGITEFLRPEDGAWSTKNANQFYFATTDRFDTVKTGTGTQVGRSRLYRLTFNDITNPEAGGTIDMLLDGTGDYEMFDNLTVDGDGNVILMEDPGGNPYQARTWKYDASTGELSQLLVSDPARFGTLSTPATAPFNNDEENSGVIDVTDIMRGYGDHGCGVGARRCYLGDMQAHYAIPGELVEGGQLYMMVVPEPGSLALFASGLGIAGLVRRRRKPS